MNRQQRRAENRHQRSAPRPLIAAGKSYPFAGPMIGGCFLADGTELPKALPDDLNPTFAAFPYQSLIGYQPFGPIGGCWVVPVGNADGVPQFVLDGIAEQWQAGRSFLLVSKDRAARDEAKAAIVALVRAEAGRA